MNQEFVIDTMSLYFYHIQLHMGTIDCIIPVPGSTVHQFLAYRIQFNNQT
jgi:hypothetical protein